MEVWDKEVEECDNHQQIEGCRERYSLLWVVFFTIADKKAFFVFENSVIVSKKTVLTLPRNTPIQQEQKITPK